MIYIVYKAKNRWSSENIKEFESEREAVKYLKDKSRAGIVAVFKGERLEPEIGETKVVRKTVVGFGVKTDTPPIE